MNIRFFISLFLITPLYLFPKSNLDERNFIKQASTNDLLGNSIKTITQDSWGFLWIGSENGICRFDGYAFTPLQAIEDEDGDSPSNNFVKKIFKDSNRRLWIGMSKGACVYNDSSCTLEHIQPFENIFVHTFKEDVNKNIWIGSDLGLCILSNDTKNIHFITPDECDLIVGKRVNFISQDTEGNFWLFSEYGLHKVQIIENNQIVDTYDFSKQQQLLFTNYEVKGRIGFFYIDKFNMAWISIDNKVFRTPLPSDELNLTSTYLLYEDKESLCISQENKGKILIGTRNQGVILYELHDDGSIISHKTFWINSSKRNDISNTITTLFFDKWGNLWAGTENGLYVSKAENTNRFYNIKENPLENAPSQNIISSIYQDSDLNIWLCSAYGLNKFNWVDKEKREFTIKHYFDKRSKEQIIQNNRFQSIIEKEKGIFWLSTKNNVVCYNERTNTFYEDEKLNQFIKNNNLKLVRQFFKDSKNNIWLAFATGGIGVYIPQKNEFYLLGKIDNDLSDLDYWSITEDARNYIWIGTRKNGLFRLKLDTELLINNKNAITFKKKYLPHEWITTVYINKDNIPWIGSSNKVFRYDIQSDNFEQILLTTSDESTYITGILEDQLDKLWIFTTNGIYRYEEFFKNSEFYDINNGNLSRTNYIFGKLLAKDGTIFLGGINGLTYYFPEKIHVDTIKQNVFITDFQILNKHVLPNEKSSLKKNINLQESLLLSHKDYQFSFEFSTLYLTDPYKITYSYKMEGFDKDWIYADARRNYASYSNLSPGNYIFKIRSTNASGIWLDNNKEIAITILPPPWGTWWAYCVYITIVFILIVLIFYTLYVKSAYKQKEKVNQWKNQLYQNIIHGFETPLFLLRAPLENLLSNFQNQSKQEVENMLKIMEQNTKRLSLRTKQLMDFQKIELGENSITLSEIELISFIQNIYDSFSTIARSKNIRFEYLHSEDNILIWIDTEKIEITLFNLLSNAFKYTNENGLITVRCIKNKNNEEVRIEIRDNGIGIEQKHQERIFQSFYQIETNDFTIATSGAGLGLTLAKEYIELHKGRISINSTLGEGSTFSIHLPLNLKLLLPNTLFKEIKIDEESQYISAIQTYIEIEKEIDFSKNNFSKNEKKNSPQVFILEQNYDLGNFFKKILRKNGYQVKLFDSIDDIFQSTITLEPALLLFNTKKGSKKELKLCKKVKDNIQTCHIPIVLLMDNNQGENNTLEGYEFGADACIAKPFEMSYLLIRMKHLIEIRSLIKEKLRIDEYVYSEKEKSKTTSIDEKFIQKIMSIIEVNMADETFNLEMFASQAGMSRSVLNTKIQSLFGQTPIELVKTLRLKKAAQLIDSQAYSITEVSSMVGFSELSYFSTCFKKQFGKKPSEYMKGN